ncbi:MAG: hypothetical protein V4739_00630 [Pseudomonadota bacterium]
MKPILFNSAMALCLMGTTGLALAQPRAMPNVAVTDLAYEERVQEYFEVARIKQSTNMHSNAYGMGASRQTDATYVGGTYSYMEQAELRNFTADLKGALLKGGGVKLVQGRGFDAGAPQPSKGEQVLNQMQTGKAPAKPVRQPSVHDIIARIKKGEFAGADYVLFGSLSNIQFRDELSPLQGTSNASYLYSLDLVSDFSLINTRTYEIKASFSAQGSGQDVKLISSRGDVVVPNRGKVIRETSQTLAESAYTQLLEQLGVTTGMPMGYKQSGGTAGGPTPAPEAKQATETPVMVFK